MQDQHGPLPPQETSQDPVEIKEEDAITINEALALAEASSFPLGKSTLQRWAKVWHDHPGGAVRCLLVTTRVGNFYKLSREDFEAWVFDQKENMRPPEAPQGLERPQETSQNLTRPHEASVETTEHAARIKELENENMQLKIDVGVRKQLLERVKEEMDTMRTTANNLLRENGALQYQLLQLAPPKREADSTQSTSVDNQPSPQTPAL